MNQAQLQDFLKNKTYGTPPEEEQDVPLEPPVEEVSPLEPPVEEVSPLELPDDESGDIKPSQFPDDPQHQALTDIAKAKPTPTNQPSTYRHTLKELEESDDSDWDQRMVASFRESWDTRKQLTSAWDEVFALPGLVAPTRGLFLDKMIKGEDEPLRIGFPNARDMVQLLGEAQIALGMESENGLLSGAPLGMILPLGARANRALGGGDFFGDETPMWDTAVQFYRERYDFTQPGWAEAFGEVLATDMAGVIGDFAAAASLAGLSAKGASVASKAAARASRQLGIKMDGRLAKAGWVSEELASKSEKFGELAEGFDRRVNQSMVSPEQLFNIAKAPGVLRALGRFGRRWGAADMELATLPFIAAAELWRMKLKRAGEVPIDVGLQDLMLSQRKLEGVEMQMMANVEHGQVINQAASDLGGVRGVPQLLRSADGKLQYDSEYMVVELDQLQPSHTLGGQVNPEHSPNVRLQPRDRTLQASRDQITSIAQDLDPEILLSPGHMLDTGTPIIGLSGRVESGNGRVLAMMQAQSEGLSGWESYQQALREKAEQFGIDPSSLEGMQSPVVVRARTSILSDTELNQFAKVSNEPTTARYSATEAADTDVEILTDEVMNLFEPTGARTLREMLGQQSNRAFIDRFVEGIPFTERLGLIDDNGKLTDQGLQRLEDTMLRRVFPSESGKQMTRVFIETRDEMLTNIHDAIRSALPQLIEAESLVQAGHRASDLMISEDLANAVVMYNRLHQEGTSPADFFAQQTFDFGAGSMEMTPATRRILEFFGENLNKPRVLREFVQGYADAVIASDNPSQALIGVVDTTTKEQILNSVIGESELETPTLNNIETTVAEAGEQIEQARDTVDIDANTTEYSNRMIEILEGLGRNIDEQGQQVIEQAIQEARGTGQVSDESLFQIGRLGESLTVEVVDAIRQAFESEGRPTEWLDNLSIHAYGDIQRGLDESARLGEVDPDSAFPPVHQAYSYERLQQWDDMEQAARQAVEKDSTDVYAQTALGRALTHKGQFDEAIEVFDNLIANNPDDAYAYISRAETKRRMSQNEPPQTQAHNRLNRPDLALSLEDAISEIGELLDSVVIDTEINRLDDNVLQVKYKTFTVEGTPVDRTVEIRGRYVGDQTVIDTFSDGSTVEFLQEDALSLKGAMGDSNIPTDISNPDIFAAVSGEMRTRQGTIRYKQENPSPVNTRQRLGQEADADIERAEEIQFGDPSEDTMSVDDARREFGEKAEADERELTAEAATFRGLNHFKAGRYSQAIARVEEAVRLDPNNVLAHGILGYSYYGKGRASRRTGNMEESNTFFEDAANSFRKALEIEPDNVYSLNGMAWYHYRKGQHSQARYYREQARLAESGERMTGSEQNTAEPEGGALGALDSLQSLLKRGLGDVDPNYTSPEIERMRAQHESDRARTDAQGERINAQMERTRRLRNERRERQGLPPEEGAIDSIEVRVARLTRNMERLRESVRRRTGVLTEEEMNLLSTQVDEALRQAGVEPLETNRELGVIDEAVSSQSDQDYLLTQIERELRQLGVGNISVDSRRIGEDGQAPPDTPQEPPPDAQDALTLLDEAEITIELNDEGQKVARYQGLDEDGNPHEVTTTFDADIPDDEVRQRTQELIDAEKELYQRQIDEGDEAEPPPDDDIPFGDEAVRQPSQLPLNQVEEFYQFLLDKAKDVDDPMLNEYVQALDGLTEDIVQGLAEIDPRIEGITDAFEDAKQIVGNKATFDYLDFIRNTLGNDVTDAPRYSNVVNQLMENIDSPENVQRILEQLSENDIDRFRGVVLQNMWERWADGGADDLAKLNENGQLEALLGTGIANSIRMWDEIVEDYIRPDPRPETAPDRPPEPETVADENLPRTPEGELPRKPEDILPEDELLPHEERAEHRLNIKRRRKAIVEAERNRTIRALANIRNSFAYRASLGFSAGAVGLGAYQGAGWLIAGGAFALVNAAALEAIVHIADKRNLRKSIREGVPHVEDAIQRGKGEPAIINLLDMLLNDAKRQNILPSLRILKESSQIREDEDEEQEGNIFGEFAR